MGAPRFVRLRQAALVLVALAGTSGFVLGSGCRDATQMTLEISLRGAACGEIHGTAITVGVDPLETESRIRQEYVTATTSACDARSGMIGTLVVTPADPGHASVIVVVAYDQTNPASCKPPLYEGCIVARRHFAFSEHKQLRMPISIDPDCRNVPCDAFSTCRTGKCFAAETACDGDVCTEPGDPGDGGTSLDGQVIPDTGLPDGGPAVTDGGGTDARDGSSDASLDGSSDGGTADSGAPDGVFCDIGNVLRCPSPTSCELGTGACCGDSVTASCRLASAACMPAETQYCCSSCPNGKVCLKKAVVDPLPPNPLPRPPAQLPAGATPPGECH